MKIGRPKLRNTKKIARGVSGSKLKFKEEFYANVSFGDKMHKAKVYVIPGRNSNLFGIDCIILFNLWEIPISTFCRKLDASEVKKSVQTENFVNDLKREFIEVFADGLDYCTKTEVKFELKDNTRPVFKPKRNILFSSLNVIDCCGSDKNVDPANYFGVVKHVSKLTARRR